MSALDTVTGSFTPVEQSAWRAAIDRFRSSLARFESAAASLQATPPPADPTLRAEYESLMQRARLMGPSLQATRTAVDDVTAAMANAWDRVTGVWSSIADSVSSLFGAGSGAPPALDGLGIVPLIPIAAVLAATAALVAFVADYAKFAKRAGLAAAGITLPDEMSLTTKVVLGAVALGALWLFLRRPRRA
jgi:hypothetical protein